MLFREEMRLKFRLRNVAESLPENCPERPLVNLTMQHDGKDLAPPCLVTEQLDVASTLGDFHESELHEDPQQLVARSGNEA